MRYGIMVRNTGMWGCTTWCGKREDGTIESFASRDEAQKVADERNEEGGRVNNFNYYFVAELKGEF